MNMETWLSIYFSVTLAVNYIAKVSVVFELQLLMKLVGFWVGLLGNTHSGWWLLLICCERKVLVACVDLV